MSKQDEIYDLLIIGAGPAGLACAIEAQRKALRYVVIDKGTLVNSLYHFPTNMTFFSTSLKLEIGDVPFVAHADKPTRREALEYYRRVADGWKLNIQLYEKVEGLIRKEGRFQVATTKGFYQAEHVAVATGFYDLPRMLGVPGEELPKVKHYYDDAHPYVGQKVVVIGAANSACDVALETYHKGAEVTMIIREDEIYPRVKYWIRPNIVNRIEEGSIKAHFQSHVTAIHQHEVEVMTPEGKVNIPNDFVLAMTGYQPDLAFLEKLGIILSEEEARTPRFNEETFETNVPNLYLAGVVQAGLQTSKLFIENTRHHGKTIIAQITGA